jgi:glycosyltransferase involved in cell wall biosynthesis
LRISIIVPAFNEERLLGETLRHLKGAMRVFEPLGWAAQLIVCDNNSTDRTSQIARESGAEVVFEPINQIARARNTGAVAASGDWLIFVDADSHPTPELFAEVAQQIQSGRCLAGGCTVKLDRYYPVLRLVTGLWNWVSRGRKLLAGSFIFCEAAAFRKVGGFSQELFAAEELELSLKLKRLARERGQRIVILHRHPLVTSGRKAHLYTPWEHIRFLLRTVLVGGKTLNSREACYPWYDGRR